MRTGAIVRTRQLRIVDPQVGVLLGGVKLVWFRLRPVLLLFPLTVSHDSQALSQAPWLRRLRR